MINLIGLTTGLTDITKKRYHTIKNPNIYIMKIQLLIGVLHTCNIFNATFVRLCHFVLISKLLLIYYLNTIYYLQIFVAKLLGNYRDVFVVICVYGQSLGGSTVLPIV